MSDHETEPWVPMVLVVGATDVQQVVGDAVAGLGRSVPCRDGAAPQERDEVSDALADPTLNMAVVDLRERSFDLVERLERERPDLPVVAITSPGSVTAAVTAIKLGAAEAVEWPVAPSALRALVQRRAGHDQAPDEERYADRVAAARRRILERAFRVAKAQLMRAVALDVRRPEAYNLLGVLARVGGERDAARNWWIMALLVDATYQPAKENLSGSTDLRFGSGPLSLG